MTIAWVFFRANSVIDAVTITMKMFDFHYIILPMQIERYFYWLHSFGVEFGLLPYCSNMNELYWLVGTLFAVIYLPNSLEIIQNFFRPNYKWLVIVSIVLLYGILSLSKTSEFLYFQF